MILLGDLNIVEFIYLLCLFGVIVMFLGELTVKVRGLCNVLHNTKPHLLKTKHSCLGLLNTFDLSERVW